MLKEFREFALKGSVIDLAVGIIIGAAFNRNAPLSCRLRRDNPSGLEWNAGSSPPSINSRRMDNSRR